MEGKITAEQLIAQVKACHDDLTRAWGASWKTELLERLMTELPMKHAWQEIAKRSHPPTLDNADRFVSIYGLCFEFIDIRRDAFDGHRTPQEQAKRLLAIAKSASWLAVAIDGTRLDRTADPYLKASAGQSTPTMGTMLKELSAEARQLSAARQNGPDILKRPGAKNSPRTYVIRRLNTVFERFYGETMQRTLANFAQAILGEEVSIEQVNTALQEWTPVEYDSRGEYP